MIMPVVGDDLNRRGLSEFGHARVRMIVVPQTHSQYACQALIRRAGKIYTFHLALHLRFPLAHFALHSAHRIRGFVINGLHNPVTYPEEQRWAVPSCHGL